MSKISNFFKKSMELLEKRLTLMRIIAWSLVIVFFINQVVVNFLGSHALLLIIYWIISSIFIYYNYRWKPRHEIKEEIAPAKPYILRGDNLDRQIGKSFPRTEGEKDWPYVKRIFLAVCKDKPGYESSAISILFGKSITELDGNNKWLAGTFMMEIGRCRPNQRLRKAESFLKGFGNWDPAEYYPDTPVEDCVIS